MGKRGLLFIAGILTLIYIYFVLTYDKGGFTTPATLFGAPIWLVTGIIAGGMLIFGARWRPVVDPGQYGDSPGCLFWFFGVAFCLALALGVYFTEPIACLAKDGDDCYKYGTLYEIRRNDGSTYNGYYRNNAVWTTWRVVDDAVFYSTYNSGGYSYSGGGGGGDWLSGMDLDDSEAAILIIVIIVIIIVVIASAFIPNVWVLACAMCLVGFYLTILRMHNQERLYGGVKPVPPDEPEKPKDKPKNSDEVFTTSNDAP